MDPFLLMQAAGAVTSAIGSFYEAQSKKYELKAGALSAEFEGSISRLNARSAESDAQAILASGSRQIGQLGLQYGQVRGSQRASAGARGVDLGVGSIAEVAASTEIAHQIDALTINANTIRAAGAQRGRAVDYQNRALLADVSARNLRRSAKSINPYLSAASSLLGSGGSVASKWYAGLPTTPSGST